MRRRPPARRRRGQALVELALCLPLLISVLLLIIEGTLAFSGSQTLTDAVHQATRVAARESLEDNEIRHRIEVILAREPLVNLDGLDLKIHRNLDTNGGEKLRVVARLPLRPFLFTRATNFELSAGATYRVPRPDTDINPS